MTKTITKFLTIMALTLLTIGAMAQKFVTQNGAGSKNGSSWANAYDASQLQTAITSSTSGGQVWVAAGTYTPTNYAYVGTVLSTDPRDRVFSMKRGVSIYGGFAGAESNINQRAFNPDGTLVNKTILSGDINGDDIEDVNDPSYTTKKADNAYHVVMIADGTVAVAASTMDGFTIRGGYANGTGTTGSVSGSSLLFDRSQGGGITLRGGGAYNVVYRNLLIENNVSLDAAQGGGGIYFYATSSNAIVIEKVNFKNNRASYRGGAIYINRVSGTSDFNISDSDFQENQADANSGGAIYYAGSTTTLGIVRSTFKKNTSNNAGGAVYVASGILNIANTIFDQNSSDASHGGAIGFFSSGETMTIKSAKFLNNTSYRWGGAVYLVYGTGQIYSSVFYNNEAKSGDDTATGGGGAIFLGNGASPLSKLTVVNNTFYSNNAVNQGGAISFNTSVDYTSLELYNNIFNGNTAALGNDMRNSGGGVVMLKNNLLQANPTNVSSTIKVGNIYNASPSPLFASTNLADGNFLWPLENGVSVDAGTDKNKDDNNLYTNIAAETDLLGNPRSNGITIDLGAIEWLTVLPVTISSFKAILANGRTQLTWKVGIENNVNHYEVERSQNGTDFVKVAEVSANGLVAYSATDNNPSFGYNYYRLVTIDNDGSRRVYAQIQTVKVSSLSVENVKIYPNPVKGNTINVALNSNAIGKYSYKLVNTAGAVVEQGSVNYNGADSISIVSNVSAGMYVLYLENGNSTIKTKLVKQ